MKRLLPPLLGLMVLAGCQSMSARPTVGRLKTGDGVSIAYETRGRGGTALVFIHCWCCDRTFWRNQLDEFSQEYRIVAVDLAGHGESGKNRETWTVAGLAADVSAVINKLGLKRVILIGHSMGGPVSLEVARLQPDRVIGIVAVDTLHDAEQEYTREMIEQIAARFNADFAGTMDQLVPTMFPPESNKEVQDFVLTKAKASDPRAATGLISDIANIDLKVGFTAARVPIRAINAVPHPPYGQKTAVEANKKYADFDAVFLDGVGHYLQLEKPDEFNELLREILLQLDRR